MKAGIGAATITPELPVWLAGFGARSEAANEVRDDLEARALYMRDGRTTLCVVSCDLLGMTPGYASPLRKALARELGTNVESVLVSCTHTHHGPSVMAGAEAIGWPVPDGYDQTLTEGCVTAAAHARDAAEDAELRYARAPLPDVSFNRRGHPYDSPELAVLDIVRRTGGSQRVRAATPPDPRQTGGSQRVRAATPPDPLPDGHRIGFVANIGVHPVALGPRNLAVSTDWVGPFRAEAESLAGGLAVELTGALGDVNPRPPRGIPDNTYEPWASAEETEHIGRTLARAAAEALDDAEPVTGGLRVLRSESIEVHLGSTGLARLAGAESMTVEFLEWSVGDVRVVSLPGEAFFALGREVEDARGCRTLLAGLAPAWHGYLPHPFTDGYEEGLSYGPEAVGAIRRMLTTPP